MSGASMASPLPPGAVAIVGMAGRFPGAPSVDKLWELVRDGRHAFRHFSPDEIEDAFDAETRASADYVPARPCLDGIDLFDAGFFGMLPREAALTDPQFRVFLEICWEALEAAGYDPRATSGMTGVFAGAAMSTYLINNVLCDRSAAEAFTSGYQVGRFSELVGAIGDTLATRVAYKLDLRGPAFTVQSACSTSLLAVAQACQSLLTYGCDMALAGGVSITVPQKRGYIYQEGGMVSPDGVCRPFDAQAAGTVFGSGAGVVLLKRLEEAVADGDHIHAVIRGCGINNDGAGKVGFTAPSVRGQADAIVAALAQAGVDPSTLGYVECHGTATPLGDPIEYAGLVQAFGDAAPHTRCALGSVKGNLGHLDAAAGVTGLIKAALALHHATIPPMANFSLPNPHIDLDDGPFHVPTEPVRWERQEGPRRAGVSSFGVGGTNVHLVLEEAPALPAAERKEEHGPLVLPLSARDEAALATMRTNLAAHLRARPDLPLADVAYTLQKGRHPFDRRMAVVAQTPEAAIAALESDGVPAGEAAEAPPVVFMFPGQGAQYAGMAGSLYESEPAFRRWIDRGADLLHPLIGCDIRHFLAGAPEPGHDEALRETRIAQPALYLVEYATARLWMDRGLKPAAMIGHSVGEFVAATLSGVMTFDDGLRFVAARGALMQAMPEGAMVSVRAPAEVVGAHLVQGVEIAAINAPKLCVVSGPFAAVDSVCAGLEKAGIAFSRLHTSHAFHSAMMEEAAAALREEAAAIAYGEASIPYISCLTGDWQTDAQGRSPDYWARHCREAVRFADGIATACRGRKPVLLEAGPGRTLSVFAARTVARGDVQAVIRSLPGHDRAGYAAEAVAEAHARLWVAGCALDWPEPPQAGRRRVPLPTYPFQRRRHWIDAPLPTTRTAMPAPAAPGRTPDRTETMNAVTPLAPQGRILALETALTALLGELSGEEMESGAADASFLELGFDSLLIGQFAQKVEKAYGVKVSFRELLGPIPSLAALARHLDAALPPEAVQAPPPAVAPLAIAKPQVPAAPTVQASAAPGIEALLQSQLQMAQTLFAQQLQAIQSLGATAPAPVAVPPTAAAAPAPLPAVTAKPAEEAEIGGERIRLYRPGAAGAEITPEKRAFIADLASAYSARNAKSKLFTDRHRPHLADPRAASGFRADWKEIVFPVVSDRSKGSKIWDLDGNEYVDLVNGMGQTAFGHAPDFVVEAMIEQIGKGFAIGPQTPLAGEVAGLISELTGHKRVTFCNTGSEAVMAAIRVARAVTGRDRVVVFANDYHGQFDEVLVKGRSRAGAPSALPIAPGIPAGSLANMVVLAYGAPESLDWLGANAADIAAIIIEPVQSRHPELRPMEFVRALREIATQAGCALVFDEVVTGFRVHPGGMQAVWDIRADMATYGKVVGGGMPIGVLAGDARFMDALDGGAWTYGDDSVPMVAPTFFAGTFVRHPVVLAAARAVLTHVKGEGRALYGRVADRTAALVEELNGEMARRGLTQPMHSYSSWFVPNFSALDPLGALFYPQMRMHGIHVQDGYPCFLTTAHSEQDIARVADAFRMSLDALQAAGILVPAEGVPAAAPKASNPEKPQSAPLTEAQTEIWLAAQAGDEASSAFNESFTLALDGPFDEYAFRRALKTVVARHDALHIRFSRSGDRFSLIPGFTLDMPFHDLSGDAQAKAKVERLIADEAATPFDLAEGPLARAHLVRLEPECHLFVFTAHHIVCDGWSANVLMEELSAAYSACAAGRDIDLPEPLSFAAHAARLAEREAAPAATEAYWLGRFETVPDLPDLPLDRPRPERRSFAGGTATGHVEADLYRRLKKAGARNGATLFSTLLAALQVLVSRLSGSDDIVIAVPAAGQSLLEGETLVGHCVNLLPLRQTVSEEAGFAAHLQTTQKLVLEAFEHQDYTYGTLVRKLGLKRDASRLPLTGIQFNLERVTRNMEFSGLEATVTPNPKAFANFDLFLNMIEGADGIRIDVDYNAEIFDRQTIERWLGHFDTLLAALADGMDKPVATLPLLTEAERRWLVEELNDSRADYERDTFTHALFTRRAAETPDAVAAVHGGGALTYGALDAAANRLARHIRASLPRPGQRVAVALDRSLDLLTTLIAIMKAGHAYVPLDPNHPEERLRATLAAARVAALVTSRPGIAALAGDRVAVIDPQAGREAIAALDAGPLDDGPRDTSTAAYVIFTSGSTGTPKGVEVSHRSLVNFLTSMAREPGFSARDTMLAVTTVSFDIAGLELYLPLIAGGRVVIADRADVQDGFALARLLNEADATVVQATPTLWQMLVEANFKPRPGLKMLCGGEPLPSELAQSLLNLGGELWNMYGPTETTIWSSLARIDDAAGPITIGRPITNTELHILDAGGRIAPVGVVGELNIGGDGLANGYFDRPDLTRAAFRDVPLDGGAPRRLYRTGDMGRRLPDGSLKLLGRRDDQIKLRGFRIELGDIEAVVGKAPGVRRCAVVAAANRNGDRQLVCYVVAAAGHGEPDAAALAAHARAHLPAHMVPASWVTVEALPQTGNGKLDRKALEKRGVPQRETPPAPVQSRPRTPLEETLTGIWRDVMDVEEIGVEDNLYALGADSLTIFRIAARMLDAGLPLEARHLLRHPTISELAAYAETARDGTAMNGTAPHIPSLSDFRKGARRGTGRLA